MKMVGELQECIEDGRDIESVVSSLHGATLPGLVEYRCLRRAMKGIVPPLPPAVSMSTIGKALYDLGPSRNGRAARAGATALRRIDTSPAEFFLIHPESYLEDENWKPYTVRFVRSAQGVGLDKIVADGLRGALLEMTDNAVLHAQAESPILVGYRVLDGIAQFCVADVGVGVLDSLRSCADFAHLRFDNKAIKAALRDGVSRYGNKQGGMGFRQIFKALSAQWGQLRFRSGQGCIVMDGTDLDADLCSEAFVAPLPGFQVTVACRTSGSKPPEPLF